MVPHFQVRQDIFCPPSNRRPVSIRVDRSFYFREENSEAVDVCSNCSPSHGRCLNNRSAASHKGIVDGLPWFAECFNDSSWEKRGKSSGVLVEAMGQSRNRFLSVNALKKKFLVSQVHHNVAPQESHVRAYYFLP